MVSKVEWFLVDKTGEQWSPWEGTYSSAEVARAERDRMVRIRPELGPWKVMERKVEVYEI